MRTGFGVDQIIDNFGKSSFSGFWRVAVGRNLIWLKVEKQVKNERQ